MSNKSLLVVALILIFQTKLQASELQNPPSLRRANLNLSLKLNDITHDKITKGNLTVEDQILNELKTREIGFDSKTIITIHKEDELVDFSCFDCIIRELSPNDKNAFSAWNGKPVRD
ncbi:MAG: hypothetical protein ACXVCY_16360 [Pseudobdellovibrionaceae bacterium]